MNHANHANLRPVARPRVRLYRAGSEEHATEAFWHEMPRAEPPGTDEQENGLHEICERDRKAVDHSQQHLSRVSPSLVDNTDSLWDFGAFGRWLIGKWYRLPGLALAGFLVWVLMAELGARGK